MKRCTSMRAVAAVVALVVAGAAGASADCATGFFDGSIISEVGSPSLTLTRRALDAVGAAIPSFPGITPGNTFLAPSNQAWTQVAAYLDTNVEGLFNEPEVRDSLYPRIIHPSFHAYEKRVREVYT